LTQSNVACSRTCRRSWREGICGSCAMTINGVNRLACTTATRDLAPEIRIYPLPALPVVKDLVADLSNFYAQYASVKPWLQTRTPVPADRERLQSKEEQERIDRPAACILCACCSTACLSYWWNSERFEPPAANPRRGAGRPGTAPAVALPPRNEGAGCDARAFRVRGSPVGLAAGAGGTRRAALAPGPPAGGVPAG